MIQQVILTAFILLNASSALAEIVDQRGDAITVLQAWHGRSYALALPNYFPPGDLDRDACREVSRHATESEIRRTVSCADELERVAKLDGFESESPLLNDALHEYSTIPSDGRAYTLSGRCEILELRTVIRDAALAAPSFAGVGFFLAPGFTQDGATRFYVDKSRLHAVGQVTLADGAPATVHRFIAQGTCFGLGGNGGSLYRRNYKFRPFARFDASGNEYQVWDRVATDYLLGLPDQAASGTPRVDGFDRQNELLRH